MIEVQFYGSKGPYNGQSGYFKSVESLRKTWKRFLERNEEFGSLKDDHGRVLRGVSLIGYKILTRPQ